MIFKRIVLSFALFLLAFVIPLSAQLGVTADKEGEMILSFEEEADLGRFENENMYLRLGNQGVGATDGYLAMWATFEKSEKAFIKYDFIKEKQGYDAGNFENISLDISNQTAVSQELIISVKIADLAVGKDLELEKKITFSPKKTMKAVLEFKDKDGKKIAGTLKEFCVTAENVKKSELFYMDSLKLR